MLELLYATGIRRSELADLALYDLDPERGTLAVRQGKGRKDRMVPRGERLESGRDLRSGSCRCAAVSRMNKRRSGSGGTHRRTDTTCPKDDDRGREVWGARWGLLEGPPGGTALPGRVLRLSR